MLVMSSCCELTCDFIFHLIFSCGSHASQPIFRPLLVISLGSHHDDEQVEQRYHLINIIIPNELLVTLTTFTALRPLAYRIYFPSRSIFIRLRL